MKPFFIAGSLFLLAGAPVHADLRELVDEATLRQIAAETSGEAADDAQALCSFVARLLSRSGALPLPGREAVAGDRAEGVAKGRDELTGA